MNNADEEECLRNYMNLITGYNELFDKNIILNNEIEQLRWRIRTLEEKQFKYMDTIQIHYEREMNYVEEIELLKCRLSEKEEESIMTVTNLKSKMCQFQEYLKRILEMERNQQENENTNMCKCCLETESRSERISVSTQCASENELSSESSISCEHSCDVDDNLKQLVRAIEHCVMSKDTCDPFRSLFEQSKFAICDLIHNLNAERVTLKQCQNDRQYCSKMLNEVQDACKCKDTEICSMKTDLITLSSKLKEAIKDNEYLRRDYGKISQQLSSKTEAEHEWLNGTEGLREELVNMKYALNMRVEEKKQILKELEEKNRTIEEDVKLKKELENKLNIAEKKLQDSETLKNVCNNECNELRAKNAKLEEVLNNANRDNAEKTNNVADLNRQIVDLKTVIKGFDAQRILYEEEITTLKEGTNAVECKSDEEIEKLTIVVETLQSKLTNANSELTGLHGRIQEKDKVNEFQINRIQSLERDIENFAKQVKEYQVQNDLLTKTALIKELEANGLRDEIENLTSRIDKITRDNDEQKKHILRISDDMGDLRRKRAELETLNEELTEKWCSLEQTNLELVANIDKLNDSLVSANKKEIYARKNLLECNEKLSIATKEIENFDLEIRGVNKKFNETSEKLVCVEQELRETVSKLAEETSLKDRINKAYSALMEERNCETRMKQMTVGDGVIQREAVCSECQTEITGKQLCDERSKYQNTLTENERLTQETCSLHKVTNDLRDDVLALKDTNKILRESLDRRYKMATGCCCGSKSSVMSATFRPDSDGSSSDPPVGRDDDEPCRSGLKMDDSTCSCTPHDCSCSDARSAAAKCDCANDDERDKLRCQLNEMLALFTEKERMAQRMLDNAERRHHNNELEHKQLLAQCQQRADELCGQVETYETMVRFKERTLTECQSRETQLRNTIEELKEEIKCKDEKHESEKNKCISLNNTIYECKKQLKSLREALELEKSNKIELDQQLRAYTEVCSIQSKQVNDLEKRLSSVGQLKSTKKPQNSVKLMQQNIDKCPSGAPKRSKAGAETKRSSKIVGSKLPYIPCCVGSDNPCNRWSLSQTHIVQPSLSKREVIDKNLETSGKRSKNTFGNDGLSSSVADKLNAGITHRYGQLMFTNTNNNGNNNNAYSIPTESIDALQRELQKKIDRDQQ